jgi:thioredoxin-like negative regulator of GroEL
MLGFCAVIFFAGGRMTRWLVATAAVVALFALALKPNIAASQGEAELVADYSGANQGHAVLEEAQKRSRGKTVFLMFFHPNCEHCVNLTSFFREAKPKTKLNYTVLRVNVQSYPEPSRVFQQRDAIPETFIVREGLIKGRWVGAQKSVDDLVKLLDRIDSGAYDAPNKPK